MSALSVNWAGLVVESSPELGDKERFPSARAEVSAGALPKLDLLLDVLKKFPSRRPKWSSLLL